MVQGEAKADFVSVIRNGKSLGDGDKPGLVGGAVLNIFLQDVQTVFLAASREQMAARAGFFSMATISAAAAVLE